MISNQSKLFYGGAPVAVIDNPLIRSAMDSHEITLGRGAQIGLVDQIVRACRSMVKFYQWNATF